MEDVEMAQDEVELQSIHAQPRSGTTDARMQIFAGPGMSESVPTSVSAFSHRRRERADSSASQLPLRYQRSQGRSFKYHRPRGVFSIIASSLAMSKVMAYSLAGRPPEGLLPVSAKTL